MNNNNNTGFCTSLNRVWNEYLRFSRNGKSFTVLLKDHHNPY